MESRVTVAVRIRPLLQKEQYEQPCVRGIGDEGGVAITPPPDHFTGTEHQGFAFDEVFDQGETQRSVYDQVGVPIVDDALRGVSAAILAYGQTGSGKTHTMLGQTSADAIVTSESGLFLRVLDELLRYGERRRDEVAIELRLSALEIYNDDARDLLNQRKPLKLREVGEGCQIPDLQVADVRSLADAARLFAVADSQRSSCATRMNAQSSRSHALFTIELLQRPLGRTDVHPLTSRVCLCDLAGSERLKKSQAQGQALEEARHINKSLSALGKVAHELYRNAQHVSFRDARLTRILRPVLSHGRILLIAALSPGERSISESVSTLRFANCVKGLRPAPMNTRDAAIERVLLRLARTHAELSADLRLCCLQHDYVFQRAGSGEEAVRRYQAAVDARVRAAAERDAAEVREAAVALGKERVDELNEEVARMGAEVQAKEDELRRREDALKEHVDRLRGVADEAEAGRKEAAEATAAERSRRQAARVRLGDADAAAEEAQATLIRRADELAAASEARSEEFACEERRWKASVQAHANAAFLHECWKGAAGRWERLLSAASSVLAARGYAEQLRSDLSAAEAASSRAAELPPWPRPLSLSARGAEAADDGVTVSAGSSTRPPSPAEEEEESPGEEELLDGPADLLERELADVERELAELDPGRRLRGMLQSESGWSDLDDIDSGDDSSSDEGTPPPSADRLRNLRGLPQQTGAA
eukprot:TRINITY_DN6820_c0_g2_i1.p1 TRINITY_DN6820_c0_g2~~TRINITY_DN6820_c0_g2_i1.p1  ORF type:complete len:710 (+),score=268.37 TRINITY_DN6820_c0_g2_i1:528-2657(+)